jgi:BetI-type transcriptional repressor, C-terminal
LEYLFVRRHREFREAFARVPAGADRYAAAIDILWTMVSGPTFHAWLELAVASRTDPELRGAVQQLTATLRALVVETFHELFGPARKGEPFFAIAPHFIFALLDGLALERIAGTDTDQLARVLEAAKALARLVMPQEEKQP